MKRAPLLACLWIGAALLAPSAAQPQSRLRLSAEVEAGSQSNEARLLVRNRGRSALEGVSVAGRQVPAEIVALTIDPPSLHVIEPEEEGVFLVRFAVVDDAGPGDINPLLLAVAAEVGELEASEAAIALTVVAPPDLVTESTEPVEQAPAPEELRLVYVLSEIEATSIAEHRSGDLGYVVRRDTAAATGLEAVACTHCPLRIELGQPFDFQATARRRFDHPAKGPSGTCPWGFGHSTTALRITALAAEAAATTPPLRAPSCDELGIEPQDRTSRGARGPAVNTSEYPGRGGVTLQDELVLAASYDFTGVEEPASSSDRRYRYRVDHRSSGELLRRESEGRFTVSRQNRSRWRLEEIVNDVLLVEVGLLTLVYRLETEDTLGLVPSVFDFPEELERPPLGGVPITDAGTADGDAEPSSSPADGARVADAPASVPDDAGRRGPGTTSAPRGSGSEPGPEPRAQGADPTADRPTAATSDTIPLPTGIVGLPVDDALDRLPPDLLPEVVPAGRPPTPAQAGTAASVAPKRGGPLRPGDTVVVAVYPDPIPLPTSLVGLPVVEAVGRVPAGLVPRVEVGSPPATPERGSTVERVASVDGGPLYPGDAVILVAHPEATGAPTPGTPTPARAVDASGRRPTTGRDTTPSDSTGAGYVLDRVASSRVRPFRLRFKEPLLVEADASGGRIVGEILNGLGNCTERVEFRWTIDRSIDYLAIGEAFRAALETTVRGNCNDRDPFATPGVLLSNRSDVYESLPEPARSRGGSERMEIVDKPGDGPNRVYGKGESGSEVRRLRIQDGPEYLYFSIDFLANSGREELKWQVTYLFRRVDGPPPLQTTSTATDQPVAPRSGVPEDASQSADGGWTTGTRTATDTDADGWTSGRRESVGPHSESTESSVDGWVPGDRTAAQDPCRGARPEVSAALARAEAAAARRDLDGLLEAITGMPTGCPGDVDRLSRLRDAAVAVARAEAAENEARMRDAFGRAQARRRASSQAWGRAAEALAEATRVVSRGSAPPPPPPPPRSGAGEPPVRPTSGTTPAGPSADSGTPAACRVAPSDPEGPRVSGRDYDYYIEEVSLGSTRAFKILRLLRTGQRPPTGAGRRLHGAYSSRTNAERALDRLCPPSSR